MNISDLNTSFSSVYPAEGTSAFPSANLQCLSMIVGPVAEALKDYVHTARFGDEIVDLMTFSAKPWVSDINLDSAHYTLGVRRTNDLGEQQQAFIADDKRVELFDSRIESRQYGDRLHVHCDKNGRDETCFGTYVDSIHVSRGNFAHGDYSSELRAKTGRVVERYCDQDLQVVVKDSVVDGALHVASSVDSTDGSHCLIRETIAGDGQSLLISDILDRSLIQDQRSDTAEFEPGVALSGTNATVVSRFGAWMREQMRESFTPEQRREKAIGAAKGTYNWGAKTVRLVRSRKYPQALACAAATVGSGYLAFVLATL